MSKSDDKFWEILFENGMIGGADLDDDPTLHPALNQKITMEVSDLPEDWSIVDFFEGEDE